MQGISESVVYQDRLVTITTARAVISGTTYAMANITSVRQFTEPADNGALFGLGGIAALIGLILLFNGSYGFGGFIFLIGAGLIALGASQKPKHWVRIGTAGAESNAIWSHDAGWTQTVVGAMTNAIVARG
jgi:hypothetical protein